jgi:hypothetical protein
MKHATIDLTFFTLKSTYQHVLSRHTDLSGPRWPPSEVQKNDTDHPVESKEGSLSAWISRDDAMLWP